MSNLHKVIQTFPLIIKLSLVETQLKM